MPLLELTDVHIHYGGIEAVKGIALSVEEGQIVTIIGANSRKRIGAQRTSINADERRNKRAEASSPKATNR